jgi:hypothetical protein
MDKSEEGYKYLPQNRIKKTKYNLSYSNLKEVTIIETLTLKFI